MWPGCLPPAGARTRLPGEALELGCFPVFAPQHTCDCKESLQKWRGVCAWAHVRMCVYMCACMCVHSVCTCVRVHMCDVYNCGHGECCGAQKHPRHRVAPGLCPPVPHAFLRVLAPETFWISSDEHSGVTGTSAALGSHHREEGRGTDGCLLRTRFTWPQFLAFSAVFVLAAL